MRNGMAVVLGMLALAGSVAMAADVRVRARVTDVQPEARVRIHWSWGGMGLGGDPVGGEWTLTRPAPPKAPKATSGELDLEAPAADDDLLGHLEKPAADPDTLVQNGGTYDYLWLKKGVWSPPLPFTAFKSAGLNFLTVFAEGCDPRSFAKPVTLKRAVFEFEVLVDGKPVKTFSETAPHGNVVTVLLPLKALTEGPATPEALARIRGLSAYSRWKAETLESLPWAKDPLPEHFEMVTDCSGYGTHFGYKVRTGDEQVFLDEFRVLRQLGVNGLRGRPAFFNDWEAAGRPEVKPFVKVRIGSAGGYPYASVPRDAETGKLHAPPYGEGVGCPHHPIYSNRAAEARAAVAAMAEEGRASPVKSAWLLTADEIGNAYGGTAEGREHIGVCPHCIAAFRAYLKEKGVGPADFGAADWTPVRPTFGYYSKPYEVRYREEREAAARAAPRPGETVIDFGGHAMGGKAAGRSTAASAGTAAAAGPADEPERDDNEAVDLLGDDPDPDAGGEAKAGGVKGPIPPAGLTAAGWHRLTYWSMRFLNDSSARLFSPMRDAFAAANAARREALAEGKADAPEARQPWFFMYALRGNTFLMGGSSLDFFDFYRYSDTGFMYETSNRDPRVWPWDSYLCDVGRTLHDRLGLEFGIYVKPHRGAVIQRALSAAARGARCIYWYTYGPEWWKGDTFGGNLNVLTDVSRAARLIAAAEPAAHGGRWARAPEVAVVRSRTAEFFGNAAQWEDGKWVYAALQHAHLAVDALDEEFLVSDDLSRYKAIYVTGSHLRRDVAAKLAAYVEAGGTLFTGCGGLAKDEAGEGLDILLPVFGLERRAEPALWGLVRRYGATGLPGIQSLTNAPAGSAVAAGGAAFPVAVGREALVPKKGTSVVAAFADGSPALVKARHGKGTAWLAAFYPGMEYGADVMKPGYNTGTDFSAVKRGLIAAAALEAGAKPAVDASEPLIEGVWVANPESKRQAVLLMNWAYNGRATVGYSNVTVRLRGAEAKAVRSAGQRRVLEAVRQGDDLVVSLGEMREGDVLLLE